MSAAMTQAMSRRAAGALRAAAATVPLTLGRAAVLAGHPRPALALYRAALACAPTLARAYEKRGALLRVSGRLDEAARDLQSALEHGGPSSYALHHLATLRLAQGDLDAAQAAFDAALALEPENLALRFDRAMVLLTRGQLRTGWQEYHHCVIASERAGGRHAAIPRWDGTQPLEGRSLLVYNRQGSGDVLQFVRYLRPLTARGVRLTVLVHPGLHPLLAAQSFGPQVRFVTAADAAHDLRCDLMSLPYLLAPEVPGAPYLAADPVLAERWAARLGPRRGGRPRIGLAWSGDPAHRNDARRSIALADWLPHLPDGADYICLQDRVRPGDLATLRAHPGRVQLVCADLLSFADTAALCSRMDLVVTVDTSVAHLAGALGVPQTILLPFIPDFRWGMDCSDTAWYPGAVLERQRHPGEWQAPLAAVSTRIVRLAGSLA